jgi:hypothetical protein
VTAGNTVERVAGKDGRGVQGVGQFNIIPVIADSGRALNEMGSRAGGARNERLKRRLPGGKGWPCGKLFYNLYYVTLLRVIFSGVSFCLKRWYGSLIFYFTA